MKIFLILGLILMTGCQSISNIDTDSDSDTEIIHTLLKYEYFDFNNERYLFKMELSDTVPTDTDCFVSGIEYPMDSRDVASVFNNLDGEPDFITMRISGYVYHCYNIDFEGDYLDGGSRHILTELDICTRKPVSDTDDELDYR